MTLAISPLQQRHLQLVADAAQVEPLPQADRAEGVDARADRLSPAQQREAGAAAADLDEQGPGALEAGRGRRSVTHRQVDQPALFGLVDDLERDAGARRMRSRKTSPLRASRTALVATARTCCTPSRP